MPGLIVLFVVAIPLTILGVYVGGKFVAPGDAVAAVLGLAALCLMLSGDYTIERADRAWLLCFLGFLLVASMSLLLSPFRGQALAKGFIQIVGVSAMLLAALAIVNEIRRDPAVFLNLGRVTMGVVGAIGAFGVLQFALENVASVGDAIIDFRFMNDIAGGIVWNPSGRTGNVYRAHSIMREPAVFGQILGIALGPALARLGAFGSAPRQALRSIVPRWAALSVLGGILLSLSLVAYVLLLATFAAGHLTRRPIRAVVMIWTLVSLAAIGGGLAGVIFYVGGIMAGKVDTLHLLALGLDQGADLQSAPTAGLSALALASNLQVMLRGLEVSPLLGFGIGAHPAAYELYAPPFVFRSFFVTGLNAPDAGALLIRLLSETGLIGALLFVAGCAFVLLRARSRLIMNEKTNGSMTEWNALGIGMVASGVGVLTAVMLRMGIYYYPPLWFLIGFCASVPGLIAKLPSTQGATTSAASATSRVEPGGT